MGCTAPAIAPTMKEKHMMGSSERPLTQPSKLRAGAYTADGVVRTVGTKAASSGVYTVIFDTGTASFTLFADADTLEIRLFPNHSSYRP